MNKVKQINPMDLYQHRGDLDSFLYKNLSPLVNEKTWMNEWKQIAERFRLFKFRELSKEESEAYSWDTKRVNAIIHDTIQNARDHLSFDEVTVTVFPALPFPWHKNLPQSMWTNGFTNGPNNIQIAIPPEPDEDFLGYMIAHELHHASPSNPIYDLTLESFSLAEWFKMEGGAEYFSLSLYPDKRWWKDEFTSEIELSYWSMVKDKHESTDGKVKNRYAFGDPKNGILVMAGYVFPIISSLCIRRLIRKKLLKICFAFSRSRYLKTIKGRKWEKYSLAGSHLPLNPRCQVAAHNKPTSTLSYYQL